MRHGLVTATVSEVKRVLAHFKVATVCTMRGSFPRISPTVKKLQLCLILGTLIIVLNIIVRQTSLISFPARESSLSALIFMRASKTADSKTNRQPALAGHRNHVTARHGHLTLTNHIAHHQHRTSQGQVTTNHQHVTSSHPLTDHHWSANHPIHPESLGSDRQLYKLTPSPQPDTRLDGKLRAFATRLSAENLRILRDIVATFSAAMTEASLTFFLYSGSLLGSWRHHGLVPWDDDVDMAVPHWQAQAVYRALSRLKPLYYLDVRQKTRWKLYSIRSHPIHLATWSWPFVDINFYESNSSHVWDHDPAYLAFTFPIKDVFPLCQRPFLDLLLPAPRDTEAVLSHTFNLAICKAGRYDHRTESIRTGDSDLASVPCEQLQNVFPFVRRQAAGGGHGGCNESLVLDGTVLVWSLLDSTRC